MFLGEEYKNSSDLRIYYTGDVLFDGLAGYSDRVPEEFFSKYLVSNSGLGSAYKFRIVGEVNGYFIATPLCIDRIECGQSKNLRFGYVGDIKKSQRIYTVCSDLYGNDHVVEHEFSVDYNQMVIHSNQYLESESSDKARRIIEMVKKIIVINDNREFLKKTHDAYAK
ncbi:hypothetical protein [Marinobacter maritimus]|uniref:hypothetical protein n=1 Tax=Marinobacter maritimus TaxID=277961 RepID=UPI0011A93F10|nr:hypothetical protein [Marinobacter maritimus]